MKPSLPYMDSLYSFTHQYHRFMRNSLRSDDIFYTAGRIKTILDNVAPYYKKHSIPKRNSKEKRIVFEVSPDLRLLQKFIKVTILDPLDREYTADYAFAYRKGRSARDNAQVHAGCRYMLKLDIRHFFESIRKSLVYSMLKKHTHYNRAILGTLTRLLCYNGALCQGACTSPQIANLVLSDFDNIISIFCLNSGIAYSRYCDDMTFSSPLPFDVELLKNTVALLLSSYHFELNVKKTRYLGPGQRREVTGAVVNDRVRAKRVYRQKLRQELYYVCKYGVEEHLEKTRPEWYRSPCSNADIRHYLFSLRGRISYAKMLWPEDPFNTWAIGHFKEAVLHECRSFSTTTIRGLIPLLDNDDRDLFYSMLTEMNGRKRACPRSSGTRSASKGGITEGTDPLLPYGVPVEDDTTRLPFDVMGFDEPPISLFELMQERVHEICGPNPDPSP